MKKFLKKSSAMILLISMIVGGAACNLRGNGGQEYDSTKSLLEVVTMGGGLGLDWLNAMARKFEEIHAETSFEENKKGVKVDVSANNIYFGDNGIGMLPFQDHDIVFSEQMNYYELLRQGNAYNVTEWVTTPLSEYGETKSIVDKLNDMDKSYYGQDSKQEYYALPFVNSIMAINYDVELFENNNWYFAAAGEGDENGFVYSIDTPRANGPDGKTGTIDGINYSLDDGLPATYDEFFKMCDRIVDTGCLPFIWNGAASRYVTELLLTLATDVEGYEDSLINYTFSGTASDLIKSIKDGVVTYEEPTNITEQNGYLLKKKEGLYYGLKFLEKMISTEDDNGYKKYYNYGDTYNGNFTNTAAQTKFLRSADSETPIAMLIEGSWWYSEARDTFAYMSTQPGKGVYERKIGILPMPKATADRVGVEETTIANQFASSVFVNAHIEEEKLDIAKSFYRYIHTDECLTSIMHDGHTVRPYQFEMVGYEAEDLAYYTLSHYNLIQNCKLVQPYSTARLMQNHMASLKLNYETLLPNNQGQYKYVTKAFDDGVTAEEYFEGLSIFMNETRWSTML